MKGTYVDAINTRYTRKRGLFSVMAVMVSALCLLILTLVPTQTVNANGNTANDNAKVMGIQVGNVGQLCADNGHGFCIKTNGKLYDNLTDSAFHGTHANGIIKAEGDFICKGGDVVISTNKTHCPFPKGSGDSAFDAQFKGDKIVKLVFTSINHGHDCVGATGEPGAAAAPMAVLKVCPGHAGNHTGTVWIIGGTKKNFLVNLYETSLSAQENQPAAQDLCSGVTSGETSANPIIVRPTTLTQCEFALYYH